MLQARNTMAIPTPVVTVIKTAANLTSNHRPMILTTIDTSTVMLTKDNIPVVIITELWPNKVVRSRQDRPVFCLHSKPCHSMPQALTHQSIRSTTPPPG